MVQPYFLLINRGLLTKYQEMIYMNKDKYPSREELDEAFHFLHDAINRITVEEEEEEMKREVNGNNQI